MSVNYRAILCYGIELTHEKELAYIERVGEERWEEIQEDFFIAVDCYSGRDYSGVLGVAIGCVNEGEAESLGKLSSLAEITYSSWYDNYRAVMVELQEFETQPQTFLICQVS